MNDDRKFRERAEMMKQLFLARIPTDVIAQVANLSDGTISKDRVRVAELFDIEVPNAATSAQERYERFQLLFKTYLEVRYKTYERSNPLLCAARFVIDFEKIDNHIYSLQNLWKALQFPRFVYSDNQIIRNYQDLIKSVFKLSDSDFIYDFYRSLYNCRISYADARNERDIMDLFTKYIACENRDCLNTLIIDNPKELVDSLLKDVDEKQLLMFKSHYGLIGEKITLADIGNDHGLTRERVRQICEKVLRILRNKIEEKFYLFHSTARYEHLEERYSALDEKYCKYCELTDSEILKLNTQVTQLKNFSNEIDEVLESDVYPQAIQFLTKHLYEVRLPSLFSGKLYGYDYILDLVEDWDNLLSIRFFGKKSLMYLDEFLIKNGVNREKLTQKEKILARKLIDRLY